MSDSQLGNTLIKGIARQTQPATEDDHLIRVKETREMLNNLFTGEWDEDTAYTLGESVTTGGNFYIANLDNTGQDPTEVDSIYWRLAAGGGSSAYTYIAYATDASGSGFTTSSPTGKSYVAFKTTTTPIESPSAGDFTGLWVKFVGDVTTTNTDSISEGSTNKYFTNARVIAAPLTGLATLSGGTIGATDTVVQAFGKTENRLAAVEAKTTDGISEGSTNKYYTDARARAALSATGPATYNSSTGAIGVNAASANTASYLVQRDGNGDFAARKVVLNTATGTDHITLGTAATIGYDGTNVVFNKPIAPTKVAFGDSYQAALNVDTLEISHAGDVAFTVDEDANTRITALQLANLDGVLRASSETVLDDTTTDHVPEGGTNLYYTDARANTRADARIAAVAGQANGLAQLGSDGKLASGQIPSVLVGATVYQGTWNANTNSPTLGSGTGTKGAYYVVATAGATALDGISDWKIGDWAIFNGTVWQKVDNTDAVISVNGATGTVSLNTDNIAESGTPTNLWFTSARVLATTLAGFTATTGNITSSDTVLIAFNRIQGRLAALEASSSAAPPQGNGDPTGVVTPSYVGQFYIDTTTPSLWNATGLTNTSWLRII